MVDDEGLVYRMSLDYPRSFSVDRVRDALVGAVGPWTSSSEYNAVRAWSWTGRRESLSVFAEPDGRLAVVISDPTLDPL